MEQELEIYKHENNCDFKHCKHCEKCLKNKEYETLGFSYCKNCFKNIQQAMAKREDVHINKEIQYWIGVLTDLFCLDHTPIVILKRRDSRKFRGSCLGRCHWAVTPIVVEIYTDYKGNFDLKVLVHEFLHACGYGHEYEINGWANFGFGHGKDRDRYSRLILRDLTGKDKLML
jgi:hypothetical protein